MSTRVFTDQPSTFPDRASAGRQLAGQLTGYRGARPVVVGVAPDAMPIAAEIAQALSAPLDTVAIAPLTLGDASTDRFGVAAEGGIAFFDPDRRAQAEANPEAADAALLNTEAQLQRSTELWHRGCQRQSLRGRNVLLVADLLVDEQLAAVAACAVRDRGAANLVYVTPRARLAAVLAAAEWVDQVVNLELVDYDFASESCYEDNTPVTVGAVQALLRDNRNERRQAHRHGSRQ